MILGESEIRRRLGELVLNPPVEDAQIQPASLDLRLGPKLYNYRTGRTLEHADKGVVTLNPGVPYLGHTLDHINLPNDLGAFLAGRSSVGRKFVVVHFTAGWIDPGFNGELVFEIMNFGPSPVTFHVGDRIGQLVYLQVAGETTGYEGQYQGQTGIRQ